jgi:hypothetical protein
LKITDLFQILKRKRGRRNGEAKERREKKWGGEGRGYNSSWVRWLPLSSVMFRWAGGVYMAHCLIHRDWEPRLGEMKWL